LTYSDDVRYNIPMMTKTIREQRRLALLQVVRDNNISRAELADILHVSPDTIDSWLKPATSKSSNPVPLWALELLDYKIADPTNRRK
jgi:DNA-directed RNA polymerase specialized sigma24 family protein